MRHERQIRLPGRYRPSRVGHRDSYPTHPVPSVTVGRLGNGPARL